MNSRQKGKVGEREFASLLRENGFDARRGQQFCGGSQSPDVVCDALAFLHIEVKRTQALNLGDACAQAEGDARGKPWIVAHRRNHAPWLITMKAEVFFALLRGELPEANAEKLKTLKSGSGAQGRCCPTRNQRTEVGGQREFDESGVPGGSPSTAGETPALPISAAACVAAVPTTTNPSGEMIPAHNRKNKQHEHDS